MVLLVFVLGALLGVLAGGVLCARYLRSALVDDLGPRLARMHADLDPQIRRMQNQLDLIESAVNMAWLPGTPRWEALLPGCLRSRRPGRARACGSR